MVDFPYFVCYNEKDTDIMRHLFEVISHEKATGLSVHT